MTGARLISTQYGYGAVRMPLPFVYRAPSRQWWFLHPSMVGLVGSLVILAMLRSCVTPVTMPGRTILWLQPTPEAVPPKTAEPALAVRQAVKAPVAPPVKKPERVILKAPVPIVETLPPPEMLLKKQRRVSDRPVYDETPREMTPELTRAQGTALARQDRAPVRNNSYVSRSAPDIPVPDSAFPMALQTASPSTGPARDRRLTAGPPAFSPVTPEETAGPPLSRSIAGGRSTPITVTQGPAGPGVEAPVDAPLPVIQRAGGSGDRNRGNMAAPSSAGFTAVLPDAVSAPAFGKKTEAPEEMVMITATIEGESTRIATLRQDIAKKAQSGVLKPGAYCCTISGVNCRIAVTNDKRVRLTFSREVIPFDVVSRLERLLPEGVSRCAD